MKQILCLLFLILCVNGFAQQKDLLRKKLLKSGHYCSGMRLPSVQNGDTLIFQESKIYYVEFRRTHNILIREFTFTYDGERVVEFKTKGKWHTTNGIGQFLILDFSESKIELQLISDKNDSLKFIVKNREIKQ